ncbi:hypothetical protein PtA15_16A55 [Puccinia triticina]|uniref:Solute carrier family 40 protein n=1 Tax=Puccinia triticina TaxID=208348 RepID=A0ABY7D3F9_9BASI|nr:uncharacterized protein PtA15_16A55 [Puccinia triticina]WAQ92149.1 hypothetical protein PtA15_16A55 [Puccinia triticina]WAR63890.1 hypothetical protein PtB15_16B49 [Puccinia triticina]
MPSESSPLLSFSAKTNNDLTASNHGILRELWVIYLIYLFTAILGTISIGSKLRIKTEMIYNSISWDSADVFSKQDCLSDIVDSRVTWLRTIESVTLGCFSALSTGYWSHLAQTRGRSLVLLIVFLGLGLNELIFILVKWFE